MKRSPPSVSVIVPAFNEEARITVTIVRTLDYLERHHPDYELLVVDDGSTDSTADIVEALRRDDRLRVVRLGRNMGKGAAVRRGMLEATGAWRLFMDADLATPIEELDKVLPIAKQGWDVVIGSRGLPESDVRVHQSRPREMMGRTFNMLVRAIVLGGIKDTQCGFKLFSGRAAQDLFERQTLDGFAFDVEILWLANANGYRVKEVPVVWYNAPNSKVSPVVDASKMFVDLIRMRARFRRRGKA